MIPGGSSPANRAPAATRPQGSHRRRGADFSRPAPTSRRDRKLCWQPRRRCAAALLLRGTSALSQGTAARGRDATGSPRHTDRPAAGDVPPGKPAALLNSPALKLTPAHAGPRWPPLATLAHAGHAGPRLPRSPPLAPRWTWAMRLPDRGHAVARPGPCRRPTGTVPAIGSPIERTRPSFGPFLCLRSRPKCLSGQAEEPQGVGRGMLAAGEGMCYRRPATGMGQVAERSGPAP